jgi:hypothetical protein
MSFTSSDDMRAVVADPFGNVYLSDISAALVRRIAPNGVITNFAGQSQRHGLRSHSKHGLQAHAWSASARRAALDPMPRATSILPTTAGNEVFEVKVPLA